MESSPDYSVFLYLTMVGACFAFSAQNGLMTISMEYCTIGMVSVLLYLAIPMGYLLDWIFLSTKFGVLELTGAAIICFVNVLISVLRVQGIID